MKRSREMKMFERAAFVGILEELYLACFALSSISKIDLSCRYHAPLCI